MIEHGGVVKAALPPRVRIPSEQAPKHSEAVNCRLAAVQSLDVERVKVQASKWKAPWYKSAEEMLAQTDCDAVYIASPQNVHLEHVRLAAAHGRHVFCEKPLAMNGHEAEQMVAVCEAAGVKFGTGFNLRFNALHVMARKLIREGAIGAVVSARCQYGQNYPQDPAAFRQIATLPGGGSMVDMGNHAMDLVEFVTGKRFDRLMAVTQNVIHQYSVEDSCGALLEFADGGFAYVDTYYCVPLNILRNDLEVNGSQGILYTVDSLRGMVTGGKLVVITEGKRLEHPFDGPDMYQAEFEAFANAILQNEEPPCTGRDGLHSQYLLDAIYDSARTGKRLTVQRVADAKVMTTS
jgi:1,5-anhydro-D-fructose reductase (1,5-anhydro-D-mannitol-forming)